MHWSAIGHRLVVRTLPLLLSAVLLALGCTPAPRPVAPADGPRPDLAQLWSEPADIASRDLFYGSGGPELVPLPNSLFTLIGKDALDMPVRGARTLYVVQDLGAALGKTKAPPLSGTRNDIEAFEQQGFIKGVSRDGYVRLDDTRWRHEKLYDQITPDDVRWTCERLSRLSPRQWRDAFRAAHYDPLLAERFIHRLQENVQMGLMLGGTGPAERTARVGRP